MQRGVGCKRCGQFRKFQRAPREGCDAGGHNDAARDDRLSSFKAQAKTRSTRLDSHDFTAGEDRDAGAVVTQNANSGKGRAEGALKTDIEFLSQKLKAERTRARA